MGIISYQYIGWYGLALSLLCAFGHIVSVFVIPEAGFMWLQKEKYNIYYKKSRTVFLSALAISATIVTAVTWFFA
ncbi:MAG: hypothetical protein ACPGO5_01665 [Patescibacteria group bacterium]